MKSNAGSLKRSINLIIFYRKTDQEIEFNKNFSVMTIRTSVYFLNSYMYND